MNAQSSVKQPATKAKLTDPNLSVDSITEKDLELKEFCCPRCNNKFDTSNKLFIHMRAKHPHPNTCHICSRTFNSMPTLLSHSYIERDIKPYKCLKTDCNYSCRTRFNLKIHMASCLNIEKFTNLKGNRNRKLQTVYRMSRRFGYGKSPPKKKRRKIWKICNKPKQTPMINGAPTNIMDEIKDSGPMKSAETADISTIFRIHQMYIPSKFKVNQNALASSVYSNIASSAQFYSY